MEGKIIIWKNQHFIVKRFFYNALLSTGITRNKIFNGQNYYCHQITPLYFLIQHSVGPLVIT